MSVNNQVSQNNNGADFHSKTFPTPTPPNIEEQPQYDINIENIQSNHSKLTTSNQDKNGVNMLDQIMSGNPSPNPNLLTDTALLKNQEIISFSTRKIDNPSIVTGDKSPDEFG